MRYLFQNIKRNVSETQQRTITLEELLKTNKIHLRTVKHKYYRGIWS